VCELKKTKIKIIVSQLNNK